MILIVEILQVGACIFLTIICVAVVAESTRDPVSKFARGYCGIKWYMSKKKKLELLEESLTELDEDRGVRK